MSLTRYVLAAIVGLYMAGCASGDPEPAEDPVLSQEFNEFSGGDFADEGLDSLDSDDGGGASDDPFADLDGGYGPESTEDFSADFDQGTEALDDEFSDLGDASTGDPDFGEDAFADFESDGGGDDFGFDEPSAQTPPPAADESFDDFLTESDPAAPFPEETAPIDDDIFAELEPTPAPATPAPADPFEMTAELPDSTEPLVSEFDSPGAPTTISNIEYKAADQGGTIVIRGDQPIEFTTRTNTSLNQFIIDIPNANLPSRLQRPFDTSEFEGAVGAIQAYQEPGSSTARVIVQLRDGAAIPTIEQEGNSLLVLAPGTSTQEMDAIASANAMNGAAGVEDNDKILAARSLEEFLNGNMKFYGKKISIETTENMNIRDVFHLISEETGINLVIDDAVAGEVGLLKLKDVPWDQALHMIFKVNKLGYTRQGNILRVAKIEDLRAEETEVRTLRESRRVVEALKVQMIPISYAKMEDMVKQVKEFLTDRGKVVGDPRTSSLLVTDIEDNISKIRQLVASLDIAPPQVLIEGKIVEATDEFTKRLGVNWNLTGTNFGEGSLGFRSSLYSEPALQPENLSFDFNLGTFESIGDLGARLRLSERQDEAKIISSPRIVTIHNETAQIRQTQQIPIISVDENGRKTVTFKPVNLQLDVVPQITSDQSVILAVDVLREFAGPTVDQQTQARAVNSRGAKTTVLVHNGDTAVIGGIYQNNSTESINGVPGLKDLPFIGGLFRTSATEKTRTELLIFLTPRVLGSASDNTGRSSLN